MILTMQKNLAEILEFIPCDKNVAVIGCPECATQCQTGGETEVANMAKALEAAGRTVVAAFVPLGPLCNMQSCNVTLKRRKREMENVEIILTLGCGSGVAAMAATSELPTYSGNDTHGIASKTREGTVSEKCSGCGHCELGHTGGICPVTLCSKGLMNGPCGGASDGKCEVDETRECGWVQIYERLKELGQLDEFRKCRIKNHDVEYKPRRVNDLTEPRHVNDLTEPCRTKTKSDTDNKE